MLQVVFIFFFAALTSVPVNGAPGGPCVSGLGSSFTGSQKGTLCKDHTDNKAIAQCAMEAKSKLSGSKFDDILALCRGVEKWANPLAPAQCLVMYNTNSIDKGNKAVGLELCGNATSSLPVECWRKLKPLMKELQAMHTVKQKVLGVPEMTDYCSEQLVSTSSVDCIEAATAADFKMHHSTPIADIMTHCLDTTIESTRAVHVEGAEALEPTYVPSVSLLTPSFKHCMGGLFKHLGVDPSKPPRSKSSNVKLQFHAADVLQFCLASSLTEAPSAVFYPVSDENATYPEGVSAVALHSLQCFVTLDSHLQHTVNTAPAGQVLSRVMIGSICRSASNEKGAVSCAQSGLTNGPNKNQRGNAKLNSLQVEELCMGASGTGPVDCYSRSSSLMSRDKESVRLELCVRANNTGPVDCFQHANNCVRNPGLRNDENTKLMLCNGATSDAPAICACEAPNFLSDLEKNHLCRGDVNTLRAGSNAAVPLASRQSRSNGDIAWARGPVECIKVVQSAYMQFINAPPRLFEKLSAAGNTPGIPAEDSPEGRRRRVDRNKLLSFCSHGASSFPMSSAHCFKNAPTNLHLADAVQMCTNATRVQDLSEVMTFGNDLEQEKARAESEKRRKKSAKTADTTDNAEAEAAEKTARTKAAVAAEAGFGAGMADDVLLNMKLCMKYLSPRGWTNHEIITLCSNNNNDLDSRTHQTGINNLVKCGQHVHSRLLYSKLEAAHICNREVLGDLRTLSKEKGKLSAAPPKKSKTGTADDTKGPVLTCADISVPMPTSTVSASGGSGSIKRIPPVVLRDVCMSVAELQTDDSRSHVASAAQAGQCLAKLYGNGGSAILSQLQLLSPAPTTTGPADTFPEEVQRVVNQQFTDDGFGNPYVASLCGASNYASVWACLALNPAKFPSREEVTHCLDQVVSVPSSVRVLRMYSVDDGDPELTAGKSFAIRLQLVDQYGVDITHSSRLSAPTPAHGGPSPPAPAESYRVALTLNENNMQGAVLWGISSNVTSSISAGYDNGGVVEVNSMIVSQPGAVQFTLSTYVSAENFARMRLNDHGRGPTTASLTNENEERQKVILGRFQVNVKEDPAQKDSSFCMFVFKDAQCSATRSADEQESDFPNSRHWLSAPYYLHVLVCDAMFQSWFVRTHLPHSVSEAQGSGSGIWVEHRVGIAAIWTGGVGGVADPDLALPRIEQSFLERLGLVDARPQGRGKGKSKPITKRDVKRAYYKKSIVWHPDKWMNVGMSTTSASRNGSGKEAVAPNPYTALVQSIFELVSEAYRELSAQMED